MTAKYTGSCKCGSVQIELSTEPDMAALCHCRNCRKSTGSMFSTNAVFKKSAFTMVSGDSTLKAYSQQGGSGTPAQVSFCGHCSSTMWTTSPLMPEIIVIKLGVLDGDAADRIVPKVETFTSRMPPWMRCLEGTVQMPEGYKPQPALQK